MNSNSNIASVSFILEFEPRDNTDRKEAGSAPAASVGNRMKQLARSSVRLNTTSEITVGEILTNDYADSTMPTHSLAATSVASIEVGTLLIKRINPQTRIVQTMEAKSR